MENDEGRYELAKIIVSGILFILAIFLKIDERFKFLILLVSYIVVGYEIILNAVKNIIKGKVFDETFLMSIATIGAFAIKEPHEAVAVMLFYSIGEYLQDKAVDHSRKSITELMNIKPEYANLKTNDTIQKVSPEEVKIGDIIVVKPGEKIPLDGIVIDGNSYVDTVALTGESVPRAIKANDNVLSGMINTKGLLTVKVTSNFEDSTVSKILELVENTASKKAKTEKFITKFAKVYTPIVVVLALLLAVVPPMVIQGATFQEWIYKALVCLVISCPCALVISIPLSYFGGIGCASKKGILVKGSNYLESLNQVDTIVFDKTGTLTEGVFKVTKIVPAESYTKEEVLEYCAAVEGLSNHPIATSIINAYNEKIGKASILKASNDETDKTSILDGSKMSKALTLNGCNEKIAKTSMANEVKDYEEVSGYGIKAKINGKEVWAGNDKLFTKFENDITLDMLQKIKEENIGTIIYLAIDKKYCGYIVISDIIKPDSKEAIKKLKTLGIKKAIMLTGDNKSVAKKISEQLELDSFRAELLPTQKVEELEKIMKESKMLAFVGDGINDAPVIARADVGISMGAIGQSSSIEASDIVIMTDEISKIATAIKIARKTRRIVVANITLAMAIKIIAILLGIIGIATIWQAVIADVGVTIVAVINALRCLKIKE